MLLEKEFRLVIRYRTRTLATTNNYDSLTELHTPKTTVTTAHILVSSVFTNRCLVKTFNGKDDSNDTMRAVLHFKTEPVIQLANKI
jgi:hypothetical protein